MIEQVKINSISLNAENPRNITDAKFKKLVKSVKQFPEMLKLRPIIDNDQNIIIGGNMRYRACIEAGYKDIYIIKAKDLTKKQENEFIVKDNIGFGEWDWDVLANSWDVPELKDWALDLPFDFSIMPEENELQESFTENDLEIKLTFKNLQDFEDAKLQINNLVKHNYKNTNISYKGGII